MNKLLLELYTINKHDFERLFFYREQLSGDILVIRNYLLLFLNVSITNTRARLQCKD